MKKNNIALVLCLCTLCMGQGGTLSVSAAVKEVPPSVNATTIAPRADKIEWRFKTIEGKRYMRQYNITTNQWIGDWILVK